MRGQTARGRFAQGDSFQRCQIAEQAAGCGLNDACTAVGDGFDTTPIGGGLRQVVGNVHQHGINGLALCSGRHAAKPRQP